MLAWARNPLAATGTRAIAARRASGVTLALAARAGKRPAAAREWIVTHPNKPLSDKVGGPTPSEPAEEENRDFVTLVAAVFVVALTLGAIWVFNRLEYHGEIQNCIASGRRNCVDLLHPDAPPP